MVRHSAGFHRFPLVRNGAPHSHIFQGFGQFRGQFASAVRRTNHGDELGFAVMHRNDLDLDADKLDVGRIVCRTHCSTSERSSLLATVSK